MKKNVKIEFKCVLKDVLDILGGKWAIPIIYVLFDGTKRFKELERNIPNINTRMLVKELKKLEGANIIRREAFATIPPTVEYSLTEKGKKLQPIILNLYKWGEENVDL
ncbi:winged helix-turn-helix transcriptional regulator [Sphingobacterium detergens]|uniref:HxlR family transcriptional regulator n=1 Tax=Sphingobacterium detergens TaxID=1145106 RepID=A0A420ARP0_SPHD1|nr:helix-turn-helix domain-containing protein [Sphingobacterium detergens]RKE47087.1 HxlR family transcriptional regulator [Sphingobacterium detergens]